MTRPFDVFAEVTAEGSQASPSVVLLHRVCSCPSAELAHASPAVFIETGQTALERPGSRPCQQNTPREANAAPPETTNSSGNNLPRPPRCVVLILWSDTDVILNLSKYMWGPAESRVFARAPQNRRRAGTFSGNERVTGVPADSPCVVTGQVWPDAPHDK
ncbi:hypothetical protein Bbelb_212450 [Branchiostoma belcheri]|nr:hypothetical protein Bbelb_212450 [Branchiostoma belcheri]